MQGSEFSLAASSFANEELNFIPDSELNGEATTLSMPSCQELSAIFESQEKNI